MSPAAFALVVIQHTPLWVWGLLALLVLLGLRQSRPHRLSLPRATLLPAGMLALSLSGVISAFGTGAALSVWALALLATAAWGLHPSAAAGARWSSADRLFHRPGSWLPLALMLAIFCTKFGVAVTLARHPELQHSTAFTVAASAVYGAFSGLFAARGVALWRLSAGGAVGLPRQNPAP